MTEYQNGIELIEQAFSRLGYPEDMLEAYDQLECLASHKGRETFLLKSRTDGSLAVAKCYDRSVFDLQGWDKDVTEQLHHSGLPRWLGRYSNDRYFCVVRDYIEGTPLNDYAREHELSREQIVDICVRLSDILIYMHQQDPPVIHRDVKPENVILTAEGDVYLIDFDIARSFKPGEESDTLFFGTRGYAPPEQYGFAQTDARADIYAFGVLLRFLLTGSVRDNANVRVYAPLARIIDRCTAFSPEKRWADMRLVKRALLAANPRSQLLKRSGYALAVGAIAALLFWGGRAVYRAVTYTPFTADHIPAYLSDEERVADAVAFMKAGYGTDMFDDWDDIATVGLLRRAMIELYGLERDYVYGINEDIPRESPDFFMPWGWDDGQTLDRDVAVYAAVKVHDPSLVEDWSSLKDDNGFYPGVRVAVAFAEESGILSGANRPLDISVGELALILANADRVFLK